MSSIILSKINNNKITINEKITTCNMAKVVFFLLFKTAMKNNTNLIEI